MATPGYTLAGFMPQHEGVLHLRQRCKWQDDSDAALISEWSVAKARLGTPMQNAGNPSIIDIPFAEQPYLAQLQSQQWLKERMPPGAPPFVFKLVEIAPLLAYQHVIDSGRSAHHCATFNQSTPLLELMQTCLPMTPQSEKYSVEIGEKSVLYRTRCGNLSVHIAGPLTADAKVMGVVVGLSLPFTHVVRLSGKCYLHNGFHRALGLMNAGIKYMPCVFRDVPDAEAAGIQKDGRTFELALLESANPPTVSHFLQQAHPVTLRSTSRIIHVSWAEYGVDDDY